MNFSYTDLISGDSIFLRGAGHIRPPQLKELLPTKGIGEFTYNLYLNILTWNKSDVYKFIGFFSEKKAAILKNNEQLSVFDLITVIDELRMLVEKTLSFFLDEELKWDGVRHKFITLEKNSQKQIGEITRENFDEVRDCILQMNYITGGIKKDTEIKFASKKAKILWERAQKYNWDGSGKKSQNKKLTLGNIVSKLCAANIGYNLLNIYELTIYQLYDQFFQMKYLHGVALGERIYTNYGGKRFDPEAWLNPIAK